MVYRYLICSTFEKKVQILKDVLYLRISDLITGNLRKSYILKARKIEIIKLRETTVSQRY